MAVIPARWPSICTAPRRPWAVVWWSTAVGRLIWLWRASCRERSDCRCILHEADDRQTGFLVECWPCGLVIEVGPVPQSLLDVRIVEQTRLAVETCLASLAAARRATGRYPRQLVVHRHRCSLDLPRRDGHQISGLLHGERLGRDWQPLASEDPLFVELSAGGCPRFRVSMARPAMFPCSSTRPLSREAHRLSLTQGRCGLSRPPGGGP